MYVFLPYTLCQTEYYCVTFDPQGATLPFKLRSMTRTLCTSSQCGEYLWQVTGKLFQRLKCYRASNTVTCMWPLSPWCDLDRAQCFMPSAHRLSVLDICAKLLVFENCSVYRRVIERTRTTAMWYLSSLCNIALDARSMTLVLCTSSICGEHLC